MPQLTCTSAAHRPQDDDCLVRLNRFAAEHRLREMRWSGRNINRIIRAAAGPGRAREYLAGHRRGSGFGPYYAHESEFHLAGSLYSGPFDHGEVWGRDGKPLVLIGHPYDFCLDRKPILRALESLGLVLTVSRSAGWYGFGTYHVRLSVPGALPEPTAGERFETEMILGD